MPDLQILQQILTEAASEHLPEAADAVMLAQQDKADGSLVTQVDARLQQVIQERLQDRWPQIHMLGEEMSHAEQAAELRFTERGLWVLDPLDGTTNFTVGLPMFGLSLAYVEAGVARLAVIYDPNRNECFSAESGQGAFLNGRRLQTCQTGRLADCVANIDYKRLTGALAARLVSCPPYRSQRNLGSCVLEWCWLAAGRIQLYLHGGQQLWDHVAGRLILEEAGGKATRLEGDAIEADRLAKQSAVAASNADLYHAWYAWLLQQKTG